jgi:hypothetical protein
MPEIKKLALMCTFWGERFTDFFERYCIPSLLTADNLPGLATAYRITILLYTERATFTRLERSARLQQLSRFVEIRPIFFDTFRDGVTSSHWEPWHHAVLNYADEFFAFLLLIPDCVYVKDCFSRAVAALERSDVIYYPVPEVCQEVVTERFDTFFKDDGVLELGGLDMANVVVDFIHPKHAIGDFTARFFVTHPEFFVTTSNDRLALSHVASHSMGFRSRLDGVSYTFNPLSRGTRIEFLEILGVGCEPTLKYFEQYLHWPALNLRYSRTVNLGSWASGSREPGNSDYAETEAVIELRNGRASAQYRAAKAHPRARATNRLVTYAESVFRLYAASSTECSERVRQCISLATCVPGLRRHAGRIGPCATVLLPVGEHQFEAVADAIERSEGAPELFQEFLLLHVLRGHVRLNVGQHFAVWRASTPHGTTTQMRIFERQLTARMTDTVFGWPTSDGRRLTDDLLVYYVAINYGAPAGLLDRLRTPRSTDGEPGREATAARRPPC